MDKGKDARRPGWFWADNKVVDVQAAKIGIHAFAVYMVLVRHLNGDEECWPSSATIAKTLGIGQRTVVNAIKVLAAEGLIEITPRAQEGKGQISNLYTVHRIGAPSEGGTDTPMQEVHRGMQDMHRAYAPDAGAPMQEVHTNKTNVNKTQGTKAAASETTPPPPPDPIITGLIKAGLTPQQAERDAPLQEWTPATLSALLEWSNGLRARGVNPGKVLQGYTKIGMLPDDMPQPPQPPPRHVTFDKDGNPDDPELLRHILNKSKPAAAPTARTGR